MTQRVEKKIWTRTNTAFHVLSFSPFMAAAAAAWAMTGLVGLQSLFLKGDEDQNENSFLERAKL